MKKVLLLGANGQLGSDITKTFDSKDITLINVTRSDFDIEKDEITALMPYRDVDYIINAMAYHKTDECEDFPEKSFIINSSFVYELAKFCHTHAITLFHISTDYVFDGKKETPYTEEDSPDPLNIYGLSKYAGEITIKRYLQRYFIFRVSSLFGQTGVSGKGGNFIETMITLAKKKTPLKIIADQYMAPTHTLDIARAIHTFIINEVNEYGVYHCCNSGSCSWYDFTKAIFELARIDHPIEKTTYAEYKTKACRPQYSVLDNTKLATYYPMKTWEEALKEYMHLKKHI